MTFKNKSKDLLSISAVSAAYTTAAFLYLLLQQLILPALLQNQVGKFEALGILFSDINPVGFLIYVLLHLSMSALAVTLYNLFVTKWKFFKQY